MSRVIFKQTESRIWYRLESSRRLPLDVVFRVRRHVRLPVHSSRMPSVILSLTQSKSSYYPPRKRAPMTQKISRAVRVAATHVQNSTWRYLPHPTGSRVREKVGSPVYARIQSTVWAYLEATEEGSYYPPRKQKP